MPATAKPSRLAEAAEDYRRSTMAVLRVAFLSSLALEFFATVGIALVAVLIGFRLLDGALGFEAAFFVLLLAPEFYARCASSASTITRAWKPWPRPSASSTCTRSHRWRPERSGRRSVPPSRSSAKASASPGSRNRPAAPGFLPASRARRDRGAGRAERCGQEHAAVAAAGLRAPAIGSGARQRP